MCGAAVVIALAWPEERNTAAAWPPGLPQGYDVRHMLPCLMRQMALVVLSGAQSTITLVLLSSFGLPDNIFRFLYIVYVWVFLATLLPTGRNVMTCRLVHHDVIHSVDSSLLTNTGRSSAITLHNL